MTDQLSIARRCLEAIIVLALIGSNQAWAQCQPAAPDSSFQVSGPGDNNNGVYAGWASPANSLPYQTSRVVGPGTPSEFNGDGTLANWSTYTANGVLSQFAKLSLIVACQCDEAPLGDDSAFLTVYINGQQASQPVPIQVVQWFGVCVDINTQYLKFPARVLGGVPAPVQNDVSFAIFGSANPNVQAFVQAQSILILGYGMNFKAMAPIVLVHGWNAGPWVWGPKPADQSICPQNPHNENDGGQDFTQAFIDAKIPFDCSIAIKPQTSSILGAGQLNAALTSVLNSFGTRHVNLIAHSKGGLFARKFLDDNSLSDPTTQIGVISLTTLDTPHHGSVLADTVVRFNDSFLGGIATVLMSVFNSVPGFLGPGANDLTVQGVRAFNDLYLIPPPEFRLLDSNGSLYKTKPAYYSTSADADLNGDGSISTGEAQPYPQLFGNLSYNIVARGKPVSAFTALGLLHADTSSIPDGAIQNDLLVPIPSARYLMFTEINSYVGANGRNHQTIRCGQDPVCSTDIAPFILQQIRNAESQQGTP